MKMHIAIITNGHISRIEYFKDFLKECDYIICADGAARYVREIDIIPNMLVGDFDSIDKTDLDWAEEKGVKMNRFPVEKDKTDTELALDYAYLQKPTEITLIGAVGSRIDHSLANILLLIKALERNIFARIISDEFEMYLIDDNTSIEVKGEKGDILSIIPLSKEVKGVSIDGLLYSLDKQNITLGSTVGISNEFKDKSAGRISLREGLLLVIKTRD